jgi:hypothetical protein
MSTYEVSFYETARYTIVVEADSEEEARSICDYDSACQVPHLEQDYDFYNFSIASVELLEDIDEEE